MKKCYHFPTWVDVSKNVSISCDEESIYAQPINMFLGRGDAIINLWHDDLVSCETRYEDDALSNDCLVLNKVHHTYTINGFKYEEDSLTPITSNTLGNAKRFTKSTPSDQILAKLCELTGAKMYGDYVVVNMCRLEELDSNDNPTEVCVQSGNIYSGYSSNEKTIVSATCDSFKSIMCSAKLDGGHEMLITSGDLVDYYNCLYNVFHEYSKFLRKEESKWEEIKKIVL